MPKKGSIVDNLGRREAEGLMGPQRRRRRRRRLPLWLYPTGVETRYVSVLLALITAINAAARRIIGPNLERWVAENRVDSADVRTDAWYDEAERALEQLRITVATDPPAEPLRLARNIGNETNEYNQRQWIKVARAAVGVNLLSDETWQLNVMQPFVKDNVLLVTNLTQNYIDEIGETVIRGVRAGARHESIAKELFSPQLPAGRFRKAKTRAKLIARDQIGKLNGQLTQRRQTDVGVDEYIWRTAGDTRVRPQDQRQAGKKYKWSQPPPGGKPGEKIQCRCYAEPVFGDEFDSPEVKAAPKGKV